MKSVPVYYNQGRWLADCPDCATPNYIPLRGQATFIPLCCNRDISANALVKVKTHDLEGNPQTIWRPVADLELRLKARQKAKDMGREYQLLWPEEAAEIENILRPVGDNHWRCWYPASLEGKKGRGPYGQSLDDLRAEVARNTAEREAEIAALAAKAGD